LKDEIGKLLWLDEILEETVIKQGNYLVNDLKCLDPKLGINGTLIHKKDARKQYFSNLNDLDAV
jgi:hypothetical protein